CAARRRSGSCGSRGSRSSKTSRAASWPGPTASTRRCRSIEGPRRSPAEEGVMSAAVTSPGSGARVPALALRSFSPDEQDRMLREGLLPQDEAVEFFDGLLLRRGPASPSDLVLVLPTPGDGSSPYPPLPVYRFSVEDYHRLIEAGILQEGER